MLANPTLNQIEEGHENLANSMTLSLRFHALDMLRSFAMLLGVALHSFISYSMTPFPQWLVRDPNQHYFFQTAILIIHLFRMELFFLISGFFTYYLYQKIGGIAFLKNRFLRIVIPFLVTWPLTLLAFMLIPYKQALNSSLSETPIFHLWFLEYLLVLYGFSGLLLLCHSWFKIRWQRIDTLLQRLFQSRFHPILLILPTLPALFLMQKTIVDTPLNFFIQPRLVGYYGIYFLMGWYLYRQPNILILIQKHARLYLLVALFTIPFLLFSFSVQGFYPKTLTPLLVLTRISYALCTWSLVLLFIGFFQKNFQKPSMVIRYLSEASYWIFLTHLPMIVFLQNALLDSNIPGVLRPWIVIVATLMLLLIGYQLLVRHTLLGRVLGHKAVK